MHNYPSWLYTSIVELDLPWESSSEMDFTEFMSKYTLHDSVYIGLFYNITYGNDALLAVEWDAFWLPEGILKQPAEDNWPYLFILIKDVEQINTWDIKQDNWPRMIGSSECIKVEGKNIASLNDAYGGKLQLVYSGGTFFLALDKDKTIINI